MYHFFLATIIYFVGSAQISYKLFKLPKSLSETSGLETYGDYLITHNDSGDKPKLYIISRSGEKIIEIKINNIENNDWEDIAQDENYVYISDSGNNKGNRKNLNILIVDPNDNFKKIGEISFNYGDQKNFEKRKKHPYDSEALMSPPEKLVLF